MFRKIILCVTALLCSAVLASAAPILDGNVTQAEYDVTVDDTYVYNGPESGKDYFDTGLDIDYAAFDDSLGYLYAGVATKHDLMRAGSPGSYMGQTALNLSFYVSQPDLQATPPDQPLWYLNLIMDDDSLEQALLVENPTVGDRITYDLLSGLVKTGTAYGFDPNIPAKFVHSIDTGVEIRLDPNVFTVVDPNTAMYFAIQLDDLGDWQDDQMTGLIPEPVSAALLLSGAGLLVRRRRATV